MIIVGSRWGWRLWRILYKLAVNQVVIFKRMGNSQNWVTIDNSFQNETQLLSSLIPIDDGENHNQMLSLGRFKIYRFKTQPYQMVMKHVRIFAQDNPKCEEYSNLSKKVASRLDHKNIARIHCINICTKSTICIKQISIESYVNYYAINLQQLIDQRKANDTRFTTGQLWYILNSLIELSTYLKKCEVYFGIYMAKNICLSPQGYIKVYLYHINPQNKHFLYYHMIGSDPREIYKFLPMPPECFPHLKVRSQDLKQVQFEKLEVFGIAMIALQAMLFNSTRRYYSSPSSNDYSLQFDEKMLKKDFKELKQIYPPLLTNLLQKMFCVNPKERLSLQQVKAYIKSIRQDISINGAIKMIQDEQNPIQPKLSYKSTSRQQEYNSILKSITHINSNGESRLQFVPLRPMSIEKISNCTSSQYRSLAGSQYGLTVSIQKKKQNKLNLSNLTAMQSISRKRQNIHNFQGKNLSSFR